MTQRRGDEAARLLSNYIKEAGGSLFCLRNSFAPGRDKQMTEAEKALLAGLYSRTRHALLGEG